MSDLWPLEGFDAAVAAAPRVVVLYYASWCPHSRILLPEFEAADPERDVPFARVDLEASQDPRWDQRGIKLTPTLVYYERGEELERIEARRHEGLPKDEMEDWLDFVERLNEEPRPKPKGRRSSVNARRPSRGS